MGSLYKVTFHRPRTSMATHMLVVATGQSEAGQLAREAYDQGETINGTHYPQPAYDAITVEDVVPDGHIVTWWEEPR